MDADDALLTLDEAAKLIPGATADTLKRMCRKGVLTCYRPGKAYLTTANQVRDAVKRTEARQRVRQTFQHAPKLPLGLTEMELSDLALDAALTHAVQQRKGTDRKKTVMHSR